VAKKLDFAKRPKPAKKKPGKKKPDPTAFNFGANVAGGGRRGGGAGLRGGKGGGS
jgi:hypothetical protein